MPAGLKMHHALLTSPLARLQEMDPVPDEILHIELGKRDILGKVLGVSKRYSELRRRLQAEETQLRKWEALYAQIEAAKGRIKSIQTEKQAIEKGLQDIQLRAAGLPVHSS